MARLLVSGVAVAVATFMLMRSIGVDAPFGAMPAPQPTPTEIVRVAPRIDEVRSIPRVATASVPAPAEPPLGETPAEEPPVPVEDAPPAPAPAPVDPEPQSEPEPEPEPQPAPQPVPQPDVPVVVTPEPVAPLVQQLLPLPPLPVEPLPQLPPLP